VTIVGILGCIISMHCIVFIVNGIDLEVGTGFCVGKGWVMRIAYN